jgi:hypothetical protein
MTREPLPTEVPVALLKQALLELREARGNPEATREALIRYFTNGVAGNFQIGPLLEWLMSWPSKHESVFWQLGAGSEFVEILKKLPVQELGLGPSAAVSCDCLGRERRAVLHAVRLPPGDELESGWRLSSGRESSEFAADPTNYKRVPLNVMIDGDPTLAPIRDWPVGTEVARPEVSEPWQLVAESRDEDGNTGGGRSDAA